MDHVINAIKPYYEIEIQELIEEWFSKKYKKLSSCPSYASCKAINNAIYELEKYYYGERKTLTVQDEIKCRVNW